MPDLKIALVVDTENSWMNSYLTGIKKTLEGNGHSVTACTSHEEVPEGDIAFFLSCERIISQATMKKNKHNIVIHASDLPKGKGWSPLTWQVLEGRNRIPVSLFEAVAKVDAGPVYLKSYLELEGYELIDEMRAKLAGVIQGMVVMFVDKLPDVKAEQQQGSETLYRKRTPKDSELDTDKTIKEQFNLLRVVDNERYPAFFNYKGRKYVLKIYDAETSEGKAGSDARS